MNAGTQPARDDSFCRSPGISSYMRSQKVDTRRPVSDGLGYLAMILMAVLLSALCVLVANVLSR